MDVSPAMVRSLLDARYLEKSRLLDKYYLLAVDMTGHLFLGDHPSPFAKSCLTQTAQDGRTLYYRPDCHGKAEAKRVFASLRNLAHDLLESLRRDLAPDPHQQWLNAPIQIRLDSSSPLPYFPGLLCVHTTHIRTAPHRAPS